MTLEARQNSLSIRELALMRNEPLNRKAFFSIVDRFRNLTHYDQPHGLAEYGYIELTGEMQNGKPTYDLFVQKDQLPKQKGLTLVHEVMHVYWEEDLPKYRNQTVGQLNYGVFFPADADTMEVMGLVFMQEERIEAEAKRFFRSDHHMVLETYRKMCRDRGLQI